MTFRYLILILSTSIPVYSSHAVAEPSDSTGSLPEVVVTSNASKDETTEMNAKTERMLNVAGASLDPLASIQAQPGVVTGSDYNSAPAIRGSAPSDNAYYIDFIPARYLFHDLGDSIFNENLIHNFDLYPAAFGAQYNNATGAVIDVGLRDPRHQPLATTVDWSFLRTGIFLESEVTPSQAFYVSFRRSLLDQFVDKKDVTEEESGIAVNKLPVQEDYQFKYLWQLNSQNQLSAVAAGASDKVAATFNTDSNLAMRDPDFTGPASSERSFNSQGLLWNFQSDDKKRTIKTLLTHEFDNDTLHYGTGQYIYIDSNRDIARSHLAQKLTQNQLLSFGLGVEKSTFDVKLRAKIVPCSSFDPDCSTVDAPMFQFRQNLEVGSLNTYVEDRWQTTEQLSITSGVNLSADDYLDQHAWQPRLHLRYEFNSDWAIKSGVGRYSQLPQLQEMANIIGNPNLHYVDANHYTLGVENNIGDGWSWSAESYFKDLKNVVISIQDNSQNDLADNYSNDASGQAYGLEFLINKKQVQKWDGWLAVSLSKTERKNERTGETRPFDYDRPLIINWVANYHLDNHWSFGLKWTIRSGGLYTPVRDVKPDAINSAIMNPVYGELNSERLPLYHRLDLHAEYLTSARFGDLRLFADILNAYDQRNIEGYSYAPNGNNLESSKPDGYGSNVPVSADEGFRFFPSIGFKVQF